MLRRSPRPCIAPSQNRAALSPKAPQSQLSRNFPSLTDRTSHADVKLRFRTRLFLILSLFAIVPSLAVTIAWGIVVGRTAPLIAGTAAWDRVAKTGREAINSLQTAPLTDEQQRLVRAHEQELETSLTQSRRLGFVARRSAPAIIVGALAGLLVLAVLASRVAGHLSRQLSRPLSELVGWANLIEQAEPLPREDAARGAPEFHVLRERMRSMSDALVVGRAKAVEAERLRAFRESARRVAHELKNPLTPIQFALARLKHEAPPSLGDAVEVLEVETARLQELARAFSQFGRLPEGVPSDVDVGEMVRYAARSAIPPHLTAEVAIDDGLPMVRGHYDALLRVLTNILLNAVAACGDKGRIVVAAHSATGTAGPGVEVSVRDSGAGIPPSDLERIWEPYVTSKAGGTGLGLAIARQTILAHHGSVAAMSTSGQGAEIRFFVPATGVDTHPSSS